MKIEKVLIAPDSFKGTMTSTQAGKILTDAVKTVFPQAKIKTIAIADGGEGTVDVIAENCNGKLHSVAVQNLNFEKTVCRYAIFEGEKAVIETASCAALSMSKEPKNPMNTTTFGLGEQILGAAKNNAKEIFIALGGSGTVDGGAGMAAALGARFFDKEGNVFVPTGGTLEKIVSIDTTELQKNIKGLRFFALSDVKNPLFGKDGAAFVFGVQKGATADQVKLLDNGLQHLSNVLKAHFCKDVSQKFGAGAAGGLGAGCLAFLNATMLSGIEAVLDLCSFDSLLQGTNLVITGEGSFDSQTLFGKAVSGIAKRAKAKGVPVLVVAGVAENVDQKLLDDSGITNVVACSQKGRQFSEIVKNCQKDLYNTAVEILEKIKKNDDIVAVN